MLKRFAKSGDGRGGDLWPVLLLLVVVMVPTIGVLWFVSVAMRNEQLASRQRLTDAYRTHLVHMQQNIDDRWHDIADELESTFATASESGSDATAQQQFAAAVATGLVDAVVCLDEAGGIEYPTLPAAIAAEFDDPRWREAIRLEHEGNDPPAALKIYSEIVSDSEDILLRVSALQSKVRCLLKTGQAEAALQLVTAHFGKEFSQVRDVQGRLIAANVELMAIELAGDAKSTAAIRQRLLNRLEDHGEGRLPASQRLFLMNRLAELTPGSVDVRMLAAEDLAARFVASHPTPARKTALQPSQIPGVWQFATPGGRLLLLLNTETVATQSTFATGVTELPKHVTISVMPPGQSSPAAELISIRAGPRLPGWRLSLIAGDGWIDSAAAHHQALYAWTSVLVILFTATLAVFIAISFRRQIRVANLKNDLVGTVSHELKTPLSSMRLLVDTLLESSQFEPQQTREYLQLIAKENTRLSRLIENFLTFSRLEQGKHMFEFTNVHAAGLIARAVETTGERFHEPGCTLTISAGDDLPPVRGDEDSLVMALLNLLDNAYKYSSQPRAIAVRAVLEGDDVCFSVTDNGAGLSRAAARRVFQKFYQVDQSLVRDGRGCGLGLSIVNYIVRAHGGEATVSTHPDKGSTFTLRIPATNGETVV